MNSQKNPSFFSWSPGLHEMAGKAGRNVRNQSMGRCYRSIALSFTDCTKCVLKSRNPCPVLAMLMKKSLLADCPAMQSKL